MGELAGWGSLPPSTTHNFYLLQWIKKSNYSHCGTLCVVFVIILFICSQLPGGTSTRPGPGGERWRRYGHRGAGNDHTNGRMMLMTLIVTMMILETMMIVMGMMTFMLLLRLLMMMTASTWCRTTMTMMMLMKMRLKIMMLMMTLVRMTIVMLMMTLTILWTAFSGRQYKLPLLCTARL